MFQFLLKPFKKQGFQWDQFVNITSLPVFLEMQLYCASNVFGRNVSPLGTNTPDLILYRVFHILPQVPHGRQSKTLSAVDVKCTMYDAMGEGLHKNKSLRV